MTPAATNVVPLGARLGSGRRCTFGVWAPYARRVDLDLVAPYAASIALSPHGNGYFAVDVDDIADGARYCFRLDGGARRADPASRHQPEGVAGPSAVLGAPYDWTDAHWRGTSLDRYVIYELHTGTFTTEGTFAAIVPRLPALADLGITAIELMPVAQFPGSRNWGYDGVFPFAVQHSYGGPAALKALVDACHAAGIAVVLDVVYNHLGPEGNHLAEFGPYFTHRYRTPWGDALNFDGPHSDEVRRFFIENALQWIDEFHIDALRLDAIHAILDMSARPFLQELAETVHERARRLGRSVYLIGESDLGDPRVIRPADRGGHGLDAQWADDFHHSLHALLTGEHHGYYADFGDLAQLADAFRTGYVFTGQYSRFRARRHGAQPAGIQPACIVVFDQNHDQIGNRLSGDRLSSIVDFERCKLAAATVVLSPFTPLLFMGQEYAETAPFPYFVSHSDADLVDAVRRGRRDEFAAFEWQGHPPDPQAVETFASAILDWQLRDHAEHAILLAVYRTLLALRRQLPVLTSFERLEADVVGSAITVHRRDLEGIAFLALTFAEGAHIDLPEGDWRVRFDSASAEWGGPLDVRPVTAAGCIALRPWSALLLTR